MRCAYPPYKTLLRSFRQPTMLKFPPKTQPWHIRLLPFLSGWPRIGKDSLRADLIAGLTGAIIVLPQGVAFATIAGMPPEYGLYAAMLPAIIAALFGSSWHLVSGPTTAISIVVFATLSPLAEPGSAHYIGLVLTLTLMVGVLQLAMGLLRMGTLVNFISHSVVVGFTAGAALLIIASQIKNFFGIHIASGAHFHQVIGQFVAQFQHINPYVTAVAAFTLLIGVACKKFLPKFPYMIAAMVAGSGFTIALEQVLMADTGIRTVGALPAGLPPFSVPDMSLDSIRLLMTSALAITVLALTEAVSIARAIAAKSGQRIDGNQEFIGQGLSNIAGSFFSGYASSGSFNRSGLNYEAGAKTPLASIFAALMLLLILLLVAPLAAYLPISAMAAILFMVGYGLIDFHHIRWVLKTSREESAVLVTTLMATLLMELESAIYVGVILSLMIYLNRTSRPRVRDIKPDPHEGSYHFSADTGLPDCPQFKMIRINGSLFFGAIDHVQKILHQIEEFHPQQKHLMIAANGINFIDVAGAELVAQEAAWRKAAGGGLYFYRLKDEPTALLKKAGYLAEMGEENLFPARADVVAAVYPKLDSEICRNCTVRIFKQCQKTLPNGEVRADSA